MDSSSSSASSDADLQAFIERVKKVKAYRKDFQLFAERELKIVNKDAETVPFKFNLLQRRLWAEIREDIEQDLPTRIYLLKARQLGSSTFCQGLLFWRSVLRKNSNSLVVAHDVDSAKELFGKCKIFYARLDKTLRPVRQLSNRRELLFAKDDEDSDDPGLNSAITISTAANQHLGAGRTLSAVHLSEFARYPSIQSDPALALATLMQTVPKRSETFVIIETTAWGINWSYEFWEDDNGWKKIFIPWTVDEKYTTDEPLDKNELEEAEDTRYGHEVHEFDRVRATLVEWWSDILTTDAELDRETLCRLRWRREKIDVELLGRVDLFNQEYPTTATDAFLTTGKNVFDGRQIADIRAAILEAGEQPEAFKFDTHELDYKAARYGDLRVYEHPDPASHYIIGADVGEGLDETTDFSAATVLALPDFRQVAQFQGHLNPSQYADALAALGHWYNTAFICCEVNGPGTTTNYKLGYDLKYPNLYRRVRRDQKTRRIQRIFGWHTNVATKQHMIHDLRQAMFENHLLLRDLPLLDELGWYMQDESGRFGAAPTKNDDMVISLALVWQLFRDGQYTRSVEAKENEPPGPGTIGHLAQTLTKQAELEERLAQW